MTAQPVPKIGQIEWYLQLHVAVLSTLAGLLVDVSRGSFWLVVILATVAAGSMIITDRKGWFRLPRVAGNLLSLMAIVPLSNGFLQQDTLNQLTSIAFLLTIWQCTMFFQAKTPAVYGSLMVWSLLMVVVAAVLSGGVWFGIIMATYAMVGLSTLALLHAHREMLEMRRFAAGAADRERRAVTTAGLTSQVLLGEQPIAYQSPSSLPGEGQRWLPGLTGQIVALTLGTLIFAAGFFYIIPRLESGSWTQNRIGARSVVGFSSEVSFDEMGTILQNDDLAMRVALTDRRTNAPYTAFGKIYFQGRFLSRYEADGEGGAVWSPLQKGRAVQQVGRWRGPANTKVDTVRQEILLEPTVDNTLFTVSPAYRAEDHEGTLFVEADGSRLFRADVSGDRTPKQYRYLLDTAGFREGTQVIMRPYELRDAGPGAVGTMPADEREELTKYDKERFRELAALAAEAVADITDPKNQILRMRLLQTYLLNPARYTYSLDFDDINKRRNRDLDPLEDFVAHHRMGHCEYFAGALVMMLRTQGIPARLVVGYFGGEYNPLGRYYQVYQRDAHAWVEAYLDPDQIPDDGANQFDGTTGAWYRLDPTPSISKTAEGDRGLVAVLDHIFDYAKMLWNTYVLDMNPRLQEDGATTLPEKSGRWFAELPMVKHSVATATDILKSGGQRVHALGVSTGWGWRGLVLACGLLLVLLYAMALTLRWVTHRVVGRQSDSRTQLRGAGQQKFVTFYQRFEQLLARHGIRRAAPQTQREFAESIEQRLQQSGALASPGMVHQITELFYRVRFGAHPLDEQEQAQIEEHLQQLRACLQHLPSGK